MILFLNPMISEKNPLKLGTNWCEATHRNWTKTATVKIFSTKEEYENYQLETENIQFPRKRSRLNPVV